MCFGNRIDKRQAVVELRPGGKAALVGYDAYVVPRVDLDAQRPQSTVAGHVVLPFLLHSILLVLHFALIEHDDGWPTGGLHCQVLSSDGCIADRHSLLRSDMDIGQVH